MTTKVEKKFPRSKVIERQNEKAREILELDEKDMEMVRGGSAKYGLPPPPPDEVLSKIS
jgi:hypothetical protein